MLVATLADGVGFEPTKGLHPRRISSPVHSTALPPILCSRPTAPVDDEPNYKVETLHNSASLTP